MQCDLKRAPVFLIPILGFPVFPCYFFRRRQIWFMISVSNTTGFAFAADVVDFAFTAAAAAAATTQGCIIHIDLELVHFYTTDNDMQACQMSTPSVSVRRYLVSTSAHAH